MLAARWIQAEPMVGRSLMLSTASLSSLSHEHSSNPAIRLWNDTAHFLRPDGTNRRVVSAIQSSGVS
jgi:hypothetical protein